MEDDDLGGSGTLPNLFLSCLPANCLYILSNTHQRPSFHDWQISQADSGAHLLLQHAKQVGWGSLNSAGMKCLQLPSSLNHFFEGKDSIFVYLQPWWRASEVAKSKVIQIWMQIHSGRTIKVQTQWHVKNELRYKLEALGEHKPSLRECTWRAQASARAMDCHQNLRARYLYHPQSFLKILSKSIHKFLSNKLTDRQIGHGLLPKFNGLLLVASSIFPENFIEIHS